jgi:hypothetical protein
MDDPIQVGFIAHGSEVFWLSGPLPSPRCARLLVQFHQGIDLQEIPQDVRERLSEKWPLLPGFFSIAKEHALHAKRVKWGIKLESLSPEGQEVRGALEFVNQRDVPVFNDTGPYFPETDADAWGGEDC